MAVGPVQLIVLGFDHPDFHGEIIEELERLRESDTVRVIDALAVHKDADGEIEVLPLGDLSTVGAEGAADGAGVLDEDDAWDVIEEIPNDSAAALLLIEHHWAVPLRNAIARADGFRTSGGLISPLELIAGGLVTAEEAAELHAIETGSSGA